MAVVLTDRADAGLEQQKAQLVTARSIPA